MIDERIQETASLYVFDLLDPQERESFASLVKDDEELQAFVDDLAATAASLSASAPPRALPADLESRILQRIRNDKLIGLPSQPPAISRPPLEAATAASSLPPSPRSRQWLAWAAAACFAAGCIWLAADRSRLQEKLASLEQRNVLARVQIATLSSKLDGAPGASAVAAWDEGKQEGVLKISGVPRPEPGKDYQLWVVDPQYDKPVDAGVISLGESDPASAFPITFRAARPVKTARQFVVSLEKKGGVPSAEGPVVMASE